MSLTAVEPALVASESGRVVHGRKKFRSDIQALRAVAVGLVVLNHLWPLGLTGGYVGVDVFFVISGFLITSHLMGEFDRSGRIVLLGFYARRVRRLLPAAFVVLACSLVLAFLFLPYTTWSGAAMETVASATYWENWLLASKSVNYSASTESASIVQHYWSLSVEEQFYLGWPLLLVFLLRFRNRIALVVGLGAVGTLSLLLCVYLTQHAPSQAYFITPVRVWEFVVGALIAVWGIKAAGLARFASPIGVVGFMAIILSAWVFDQSTAFPGYAALLPTVGTALVIVAGTDGGWRWYSPVTEWRTVRFLGDISYSLYLWHWPLIVIAPYVFVDILDEGRLRYPHRFVILTVAILLAWLTKVYIEDRGIRSRLLTRGSTTTFIAMITGMSVVAGLAVGLERTHRIRVERAELAMMEDVVRSCHGAAAMTPGADCPDKLGKALIPDMGPANRYWYTPPECVFLDRYMVGDRKTTHSCDFSNGDPRAKTVWLVGDSHAQQWTGPIVDLAKQRGWRVHLSFLGLCPMVRVAKVPPPKAAPEDVPSCTRWATEVHAEITRQRPTYVFTSFFAREEPLDDKTGRSQDEQYRDALARDWAQWRDAGSRVVVLADPPLNDQVRDPNCASMYRNDPTRCSVIRDRAQPADPLSNAARAVPGVLLIDLEDYFCDSSCHSVVGNVVVYFDPNHLNREFSRSLRPMIAEQLDGSLGHA